MRNILHFIVHFLLFVCPIVAYYTARAAWFMKDDRYKNIVYGNEIYRAIAKSKQRTPYRKLIIGDSTANQFYNCKKDDPDSACTLACNQAIGMVGQFLLLNNYLNAGNRPDTVYLVYTPFSFWDNLDQVYTYHYFLKPFYYDEYKPLMTSTVREQISKIPKYWLCHLPYILTTGWAPTIENSERHYTFLSPVCREYLTKIDSLSRYYAFHWEIVPTYVATHWHDTVRRFNRQEYSHYSYAAKMDQYLDSLSYLDDTCFVDDVHLRSPQHYQARLNRRLHLR